MQQSPEVLAQQAIQSDAGAALWRSHLTWAIMARTGADHAGIVDGLKASPDGGHGMGEAVLDDLPKEEREELVRAIGEYHLNALVDAARFLLGGATAIRFDGDVPPEAVVLAVASQARWKVPQPA